MKKIIALIVSIMMVLALAVPAAAFSSVPVKSIKLSSTKLTLKVGEMSALKVTLSPAKTTQKLLTFVTGNKNIASVDTSGKITAVGMGTTDITVVSSINKKVMTKCTVTVISALKPAKLIWYSILPEQRDQDEVFAAFNKQVKAKINATVEIRGLEWGSYNTKLQTAAAAGEDYDITWISDWMDVKYANFAINGAIIPLDNLLAKYAPKTKALIADKFWDLMKVKGKIYGVPNYQMFFRQAGMWVKKDLADKYKLNTKNIKSYKDLVPFFAAVKAGEKEITPLAANSGYIWNFQDSYGVTGDEGKYRQLGGSNNAYASNPTKAINDYLDATQLAKAKKGMDVARDWYLKGYVRSDLLAIQDLGPEIKAGKFAAGFQTYKPGGEASFKDTNGYEAYIFPIAKPQLSGVTATELAISATSKNPERAMMLIELINNDVALDNLLVNGIEGKHYIKTAVNKIARVENNGYQPNLGWMFGNTFNQYLVPGQTDATNELILKGNDESVPQYMGDWTFDNEKVKSEDAAVNALWQEYGNPLWAGAIDTDKYLTQYVEKIKGAGGEKIQAEVQRQLDEYLKSHK